MLHRDRALIVSEDQVHSTECRLLAGASAGIGSKLPSEMAAYCHLTLS